MSPSRPEAAAIVKGEFSKPATDRVSVPEVTFMNVRFSNLTYDSLCDLVDSLIKSRRPGYLVTPNVDHVIQLQKNERLRAAYDRAAASLADGVPIIWASKLLRKPLAAKLSGSDLVPELSALAAERGYRLFLFGAAPGVADEAAEVLRKKHPEIQIVGTYSPPIGFDRDPELNAAAIAAVRDTQPDILFVALGCPKQELWLHDNIEALGVPVALGIGASLDFVAGKVRRAPRWMQQIGAEWLWRLCQEPRRLWRRYLVDDAQFIPLLWREYRLSRRSAPQDEGLREND